MLHFLKLPKNVIPVKSRPDSVTEDCDSRLDEPIAQIKFGIQRSSLVVKCICCVAFLQQLHAGVVVKIRGQKVKNFWPPTAAVPNLNWFISNKDFSFPLVFFAFCKL